MMPLEKVMQQRDMFRCRVELMRMFTELSDEALAYVWRPIAYAYFHTDEHNPEVLTSDDMKRMGLIRMTAHGSPEEVDELDSWRVHVARRWAENRRWGIV